MGIEQFDVMIGLVGGLVFLGLLLYFFGPGSRKSQKNEPATLEDIVVTPPELKSSQKPTSKVAKPAFAGFKNQIQALFSRSNNSDLLEQFEELLYTSDFGPQTVQRLLDSVQGQLSSSERTNPENFRSQLKTEITGILEPVHESLSQQSQYLQLNESKKTPVVWLIVGVNGAGKTTTIGKLSAWAANQGQKVLVAAGDTFRAAAGSQLAVWTQRAQVEIFQHNEKHKPSGVAFEACEKAVKEQFDIVIIDTAGRLHTQSHLMEELKKIKRVIEKAVPGAPQEVVLVVDGNNGQNAIQQAREFHQSLQLTGVILTKLDGTAKGGVVVGIANELRIPIRALGVGEGIGDIKSFSTREFVDSIL